ncbi:MAG: recombinase A [Verrucomicrobia bacterium]|nr:recombinase A [Verrucomicrobiota bacterium]MDA1087170.1 recombinase A [Verrucomicrobiota bacterium]
MMLSTTPELKGAVVASRLFDSTEAPASNAWCLDSLAGRLVEATSDHASALLTTAATLILEAQRRGELAAWVGTRESSFYPPDFAASGIDLKALPVIRAQDTVHAARAADALLRSGGFCLVVFDLGRHGALSSASQTRLTGLARKHHSVLLCMTSPENGRSPLGSLVSVRGEALKCRDSFDRFACQLHIVKDKRTGPGWKCVEVYRGPGGLC